MFLISQVGAEEGAEHFLDRLEEDRAVRGVLFRTAGGLLVFFLFFFSFLFSPPPFLVDSCCAATLTYKKNQNI